MVILHSCTEVLKEREHGNDKELAHHIAVEQEQRVKANSVTSAAGSDLVNDNNLRLPLTANEAFHHEGRVDAKPGRTGTSAVTHDPTSRHPGKNVRIVEGDLTSTTVQGADDAIEREGRDETSDLGGERGGHRHNHQYTFLQIFRLLVSYRT